MKNVVFYGDSNTWGFDPRTGKRYPFEKRWTSICAEALGPDFFCIPSGMNGRMTIFDDPLKGCRNGFEGLDYVLQTHKPIDLFVLMLGTNDLKKTDAKGSAAGLEQLVQKLISANERYNLSSPVFLNGARFLLISPVLVMCDINESGKFDAREESRKLAGLYAGVAEKYQLDFFDASTVTAPSEYDGVHLSLDGHALLGKAIAGKIREMNC